MERDAWNKQHRQKRFQGMGFPVKEPNEYACIVLKSLFCTSGWSLFLSVQLSVQNFPTESLIASHGAGKGKRPNVFTCALPPPRGTRSMRSHSAAVHLLQLQRELC